MTSRELPENFEPITPQRAFDAAWDAFVLKDGQPAADSRSACRYLTTTGRKCAIGLCIPDGHPAQHDGCGVGGLTVRYPELFAKDEPIDRNLLGAIQSELHDTLQRAGEWHAFADTQEKRAVTYRAFAAKRNLTIPGEEA
jgi:hypothetical protein